MKRTVAAIAAASAVLALVVPVTAQAAETRDTYIIAAQGNVSALSAKELSAAVKEVGGTNVKNYAAIRATVADLTAAEAAELDATKNVVVSKDGEISAIPVGTDKQAPITKADKANVKDQSKKPGTQAVANSWGLDRIDQRALPVNGQYNLPAGVNGTGVHAYIFDTGLAKAHPEFAGRVGQWWDAMGDGRQAEDCNGHGTHVTGTIASTLFGVAPKTIVHPVRVLGCNGQGAWSGFINALNAVAASRPGAASVANASLGGGFNAAVNTAVANFINATGMPFAIAAGNSSANAGGFSPASTPTATTVASSTEADRHSSFSNWGPVVDLYAPGSNIWSTYYLDPSRKLLLSGTSMATPHVAGWYALYFSVFPSASNAVADSALFGMATPGVIVSPPGGTVNRLLFTDGIRRPAAAPSLPANARITVFFGRAVLEWDPPATGDPITGYRIFRRSGILPIRVTLPPTARSYTFRLVANRQYTVSVAAANASGVGRAAVRVFTAPAE